LIVDAGGFSRGKGEISVLKADYLVKGLTWLGYDAVNIGTKDLYNGSDFIRVLDKTYPIPFLSANIVYAGTEAPLIETPYKILTLKSNRSSSPFSELRVGLVGLCEPRSNLVPTLEEGPALKSLPPLDIARTLIPDLKSQVDLVVVLYHGRFTYINEILLNVPGIDVMVMGGEYYKARSLQDPPNDVVVGASVSLGKYASMLVLTLDKDMNILSHQSKQIALSENVKSNQRYLQLVTDYETAVRTLTSLSGPQSQSNQ
jgi:2',3'-cyclic-nucleotide 2'-phosphodiesterase (5'-nucleotidase family)